MKKIILYVSLFFSLLLCSAIIIWFISRSWSFTLIGSLVNRVDTEKPLIALTFDDGPQPEFTEEILQILADYNAKATFFVTGAEMEQNPEQGKKIVAAGHELGNHSYSHKTMVLRTPSFVREEIAKT